MLLLLKNSSQKKNIRKNNPNFEEEGSTIIELDLKKSADIEIIDSIIEGEKSCSYDEQQKILNLNNCGDIDSSIINLLVLYIWNYLVVEE